MVSNEEHNEIISGCVDPDHGLFIEEYLWIIGSASFFKIKYIIFLDTLIQKIFFEIIKINNFRGELTDNSAKKEALIIGCAC